MAASGVNVQTCGESVIASAARQSRWRRRVLRGRRCGHGVEIATAPAPRNDNPLKVTVQTCGKASLRAQRGNPVAAGEPFGADVAAAASRLPRRERLAMTTPLKVGFDSNIMLIIKLYHRASIDNLIACMTPNLRSATFARYAAFRLRRRGMPEPSGSAGQPALPLVKGSTSPTARIQTRHEMRRDRRVRIHRDAPG